MNVQEIIRDLGKMSDDSYRLQETYPAEEPQVNESTETEAAEILALVHDIESDLSRLACGAARRLGFLKAARERGLAVG